MRFLIDETYLKRLHVVKDVECICVGIRKIYEYHLSPTLIIDKKTYLKDCQVYLNAHYMFKALPTLHARGVCFQNRYQHRKFS